MSGVCERARAARGRTDGRDAVAVPGGGVPPEPAAPLPGAARLHGRGPEGARGAAAAPVAPLPRRGPGRAVREDASAAAGEEPVPFQPQLLRTGTTHRSR